MITIKTQDLLALPPTATILMFKSVPSVTPISVVKVTVSVNVLVLVSGSLVEAGPSIDNVATIMDKRKTWLVKQYAFFPSNCELRNPK